jgi:hypothetical protein
MLGAEADMDTAIFGEKLVFLRSVPFWRLSVQSRTVAIWVAKLHVGGGNQ